MIFRKPRSLGWGTPIYDITAYLDGSVYSWLTTSSWWWTLLEAMFNAAPTHPQLIGWVHRHVLPLFWRRFRDTIGSQHHTSQGEK